MRKLLATIVGLGLLAAVPARAERLRLSCTVRGVPRGAQAWIEVEPEQLTDYVGSLLQLLAPTPADSGLKESKPPVGAEPESKHAWRFDIPTSGEVVPASFDFNFPS